MPSFGVRRHLPGVGTFNGQVWVVGGSDDEWRASSAVEVFHFFKLLIFYLIFKFIDIHNNCVFLNGISTYLTDMYYCRCLNQVDRQAVWMPEAGLECLT